MIKYLAVLIIIFSPLLSLKSALACKCRNLIPQEAFETSEKKASVIFVGKVKQELENSGTKTSQGSQATFQVKRFWKGDLNNEVTIYSGPDECEVRFEVGKEYLIFAYPSGQPQILKTNICEDNGLIKEKSYSLKKLGKGIIPKSK